MHSSLVISALWLVAQAASEPARPVEKAVAAAIEQLSADEFDVRQRATDFLWEVGEPAAAALRLAAQSPDPEVRLRASSILDRYSYGIFVETPQHEVKLINQFRFGGDAEKRSAYKRLAKIGSVSTLLALAQRVPDVKLRQDFRESILKRLEEDRRTDDLLRLADQWRRESTRDSHRKKIESSMRRQVPRLLASGNTERAEIILLEAATTDEGMRDWAVYLLLQQKLDSNLVAPQQAKDSLSPLEQRQQVYLWRVKGDLQSSAQIAQSLDGTNEWLRGVLFEQRDWETLAVMLRRLIGDDQMATSQNVEALGYAAAFFRLSGQEEYFQRSIERIEQLAKDHPSTEWNCAEALLINHQIDPAINMLRGRWRGTAFEMLCVQERYQEAFQLAGIDDPSGDNMEWFQRIAAKAGGRTPSVSREFELAVHVARVLYRLGEQDQALRAFDILTKAVQRERGNTRLFQICKAEYRAGLWQRAYEHAARILERAKHPDPLPTVFPKHTDLARVWWEYFHNSKSMPGEQALLRIHKLLRTKELTQDELIELAGTAAENSEPFEEGKRATWLTAIARTLELNGRADLAKAYLEQAAPVSSDAALRLGDLAAQAEDWEAAVDFYEKACDLDQDSSLARYLHGKSLIRLGQEETGRRQIALATLLPLADTNARMRIATGLKQRGMLDEAMEEWQLIRRSGGLLASLKGNFRDTSLIRAAQNVGNSLADNALARADLWEIMHLSCLEQLLWIPNYRGYFHTPHILHKTRAQAFLQAGQIEDAVREIHISRSFMPGNIELAEHLVPALEQEGQHDQADKLFDQSFEFVINVCKQFPDSPLHHNNLAWLCARCDRQLDEALRHVRRALELAPDTASYVDTLGEVHFRRGEYEQAILCARRCIELESGNEFFHQQLDRFQQAAAEASRE